MTTDDIVPQLFKIYDESKNRILLYVRSVVPSDTCYEALRKLILDELGMSGAEGKARRLFEEWNGRNNRGGD